MRCAKSVVLLLTLVAGMAQAEPNASTPAEPHEEKLDAPTPTSEPPAPANAAPPSAPTPPVAPPAETRVAPSHPPSSSAGRAQVRFAVSRPEAWLEARPFGSGDPWQPRCKAPCGEWVEVEGAELRVTAKDMTPSSSFRIEPGSGVALLTVNGGSSAARALGRLGLTIGVPLSLVGMAGFGYGHFDERKGLETAGAISLAAGAALVLVALPLLVSGSTSVRNAKGDLIAAGTKAPTF